MLVGELADAAGSEDEERAVRRRQAEPARESARAACDRGRTAGRALAGQRGEQPRRRARRPPARTRRPGSRRARGPSRAARSLICVRRQPLVVAVVPLRELGARCGSANPASARRLERARERAGPDRGEGAAARARAASAAAFARPASLSGMSVRPVCWPLTVQSVSAWRTTTSSPAISATPPSAAASAMIVRRSRVEQARRDRLVGAREHARERRGLALAARRAARTRARRAAPGASATRDRAAAWARRGRRPRRAPRAAERRVAREERRGVAVLADPEQHDVEHGHAVAPPARARAAARRRRSAARLGAELALDAVHERAGGVAEQRLARPCGSWTAGSSGPTQRSSPNHSSTPSQRLGRSSA